MPEQGITEVIRLTYEDFCALPDDGKRYEILDGDLFVSPSPDPQHQRLLFNLATILRAHVRKHKLGEVFIAPLDVLLSEHNTVEPDLIYVANDSKAAVTKKNIQGPPELLVEVLSEWNAVRDTRDKRNIYARCGVAWYWIVDPERQTVLELKRQENTYAVCAELAGESVFRPQLFPSFDIPLAELWS